MVEAAEYSLISGQSGKGCVILGSQWGDEGMIYIYIYIYILGKGKIVDILSETADLCIRFNGGSNAGHTVVVGEKHYAFHLLPSGVLWPNCRNVLGNGVVVHLPTMFKEMQEMKDADVDLKGRIIISNRYLDVILYLERKWLLGHTRKLIYSLSSSREIVYIYIYPNYKYYRVHWDY